MLMEEALNASMTSFAEEENKNKSMQGKGKKTGKEPKPSTTEKTEKTKKAKKAHY